MRHRIKKNHVTTQWSGGDSTELFIYPEDSQYKSGNYQFRLSTATVEIESSTFTPLPDVDRTLLVLEGQMDLDHEGHHSSSLSALESDNFNGSWNTKSKGTCVDFNLMCKSGTQGKIKGLSLSKGSKETINLEGKMIFIFLYKGSLSYDNTELNQGDLLVLDETSTENTILADEESTIVLVKITELI